MRHLLTLALFLALQTVHAQSERWEYLEVKTVPGGFNSKTAFAYDDGSRVLKMGNRNASLKDSTGAELQFNSAIEGLNYLGALGWECFSQSVDKSTGFALDVYLFKRRKR